MLADDFKGVEGLEERSWWHGGGRNSAWYAGGMSPLSMLSDCELVERLPGLVQAERYAMAEVIEHLVEMERRRLYLKLEVGSLYGYCTSRLGYSADAAIKRHRVAKLALRVPQALDELRAGTLNLTALFLLSSRLTEGNAAEILGEARGKSRRELEQLIARWFPRPDVLPSVGPVSSTCPGTGEPVHGRLEPLSPSRLRVEFTTRVEVYGKIDRARELLSHAVPSGDLGELFERALDALIAQEERKRFGAGKPRKARKLEPGSRHVPVAVARAVWERDGARCTFVGAGGHRCTERRFLTLEHRVPFALGGLPTLENLCLLCSAHNQERAREVFGPPHVEAKMLEKQAPAEVLSSLCALGFGRSEASAAVEQALGIEPGLGTEPLLRKCLLLLVPKAS